MRKNILLIITCVILFFTLILFINQKFHDVSQASVRIEIVEFMSRSPIEANLTLFRENNELVNFPNSSVFILQKSMCENARLVVCSDGYKTREIECSQIFKDEYKNANGHFFFTAKLTKAVSSTEFIEDPLQSPGEFVE
jgi:hypothetical protein